MDFSTQNHKPLFFLSSSLKGQTLVAPPTRAQLNDAFPCWSSREAPHFEGKSGSTLTVRYIDIEEYEAAMVCQQAAAWQIPILQNERKTPWN